MTYNVQAHDKDDTKVFISAGNLSLERAKKVAFDFSEAWPKSKYHVIDEFNGNVIETYFRGKVI